MFAQRRQGCRQIPRELIFGHLSQLRDMIVGDPDEAVDGRRQIGPIPSQSLEQCRLLAAILRYRQPAEQQQQRQHDRGDTQTVPSCQG